MGKYILNTPILYINLEGIHHLVTLLLLHYKKDAQVKEGYVYVITNPAWPDWVKIGMAIDAEDRLNGYQTSSPMRDYELVHAISTPDRARAERVAHKAAAMCGERKGEWFKIDTQKL